MANRVQVMDTRDGGKGQSVSARCLAKCRWDVAAKQCPSQHRANDIVGHRFSPYPFALKLDKDRQNDRFSSSHGLYVDGYSSFLNTPWSNVKKYLEIP